MNHWPIRNPILPLHQLKLSLPTPDVNILYVPHQLVLEIQQEGRKDQPRNNLASTRDL
jgi:hypothetical protein